MRTRSVKQGNSTAPHSSQVSFSSRQPVQAKAKTRPTWEDSEVWTSNIVNRGPSFGEMPLFPDSRASDGAPLPPQLRSKMETAFNADFSSVRVHPGAPSADSISALAFTQGNHINIAPGKYDTTSTEGQTLIGHELAHVVQQRMGRVPSPESSELPINEDPSLESEADRLGAEAAHGHSAKEQPDGSSPLTSSASKGPGRALNSPISSAAGMAVVQPNRHNRGSTEERDTESSSVMYMDPSGVAHDQPDPTPKARQASPVIYMDPHGVGHKEPESEQVNLPPRMIGMPYHRQFDASGKEKEMQSVLARHPTDSNKFAEADDSLRSMMFGTMETSDSTGTTQKPMKPGAVFGEDKSGNLMPADVTDDPQGSGQAPPVMYMDPQGVGHSQPKTTFKSSPPAAMTTNSGFKNASKAAATELASGGHSLITTSQVNSGEVVDPTNPASKQSDITSPRLAVNWGRHDPTIDDATLKERLTNGAMRYDNPNSASTPVSSRFSSYQAYNESFDAASDELMQRAGSGALGVGPTRNSAKVEANQGSQSGEYFRKSSNKPQARATNFFAGVTSNNPKNRYNVNAAAPTTTPSTMANFNINAAGEPTIAQHYPINKPLVPGNPVVSTGNFAPAGPGPASGTAIQDPRDVVKQRLTQQLEAATGGPLQKNPYDEMFS